MLDSFSFLDRIVFTRLFNRSIQSFVDFIQRRHHKKLFNLGINLPRFHGYNKTVFNFSKYFLSKREEFLLSFGLEFCLPNYKPTFCQFYLPLETLFHRLKNLNLCTDLSRLQNELMVLSHKAFSKLKTHWAPFFNKNDYETLKTLSKRDDLIITKPDKGRGTVILDKFEYVNKMTQILNDRAKFEEIGLPDYQTIFRTEDKINRFLRSLKNENIINENTYQDLFVTGSSFGILYGLPKVHKPDVPLRPILASYRTPNYKLAKFLVPLLESLTSNKYTVTNSEHFKQRILPQDSDLFMASFDVESLFTNIPVRDPIDIILDKLFPTPDSSYHNFSRSHFKMFLELAVLDTAFIFNGVLFRQIEGMAMGSPLGPTFANIFMCSLEEQ